MSSLIPLSRSPGLRRRAAFTLVELLAVIAIVGVVAGLILIGLGAMRQRANTSVCQSNLRQIGAAVLTFASDHRGQLPGRQLNASQAGLAAAQPAYVSINNWNRLAPHLAPYLAHKLPEDGGAAFFPPFVCPGVAAAYPEIVEDPGAAIYVINPHNLIPGDGSSRPFGNANGSPRTPSLRLSAIPDPVRTYMLSDIDKESTGAGSWPVEAASPVHGSVRNQVFFDGHVEAVPLSKAL